MSKALTTLPPEARAAVALNSSQTEIDLRALAIKNVNITQVIDKPGREQAHGAVMEIKRVRVTIEKTGKEARDDATKFSKAVIQEEKRLIAIIEPEEVRLLDLRDGWDDEQARIRAEAERIERARITAIHERIADIRGYVTLAAQCRTAARIEELLGKLSRISLDGFEEFVDEATAAHQDAMKRVEALLIEKHQEEQERARVKAEQEAEAQRLAGERAALEKEKAEVAAARAAHASAMAEMISKAADIPELKHEPAPAAAIPAAEPAKAPAFKNMRPKDMVIVGVLASHFHVHESKVLEWLLAMDFNKVSAAISAEFY